MLLKNNANVLDWDILNSIKSIILDSKTGDVFDVSNPRRRKDNPIQNPMIMNIRGIREKQKARIKIFNIFLKIFTFHSARVFYYPNKLFFCAILNTNQTTSFRTSKRPITSLPYLS